MPCSGPLSVAVGMSRALDPESSHRKMLTITPSEVTVSQLLPILLCWSRPSRHSLWSCLFIFFNYLYSCPWYVAQIWTWKDKDLFQHSWCRISKIWNKAWSIEVPQNLFNEMNEWMNGCIKNPELHPELWQGGYSKEAVINDSGKRGGEGAKMSLRVWAVVFQPLSWGTQWEREWEWERGRRFRKCAVGCRKDC